MAIQPESEHAIERSVLIVDDEDDARLLARMALEHAGWKVEQAATAIEALAKVRSEHYDLLTLDLRMPGMDGYALLPQLREWLPDTPIVVISAEPRDGAATAVLRLGASDYVEKPYNSDELTARVDRLAESAERTTRAITEAASSRDLLETLPSINLRMLDADSITWASATIRTVLGHDPEALIGRGLDGIVRDPEADRATIAEADEHPRRAVESTLELRDSTGRWHLCTATTVVIPDATGHREIRRSMVPNAPTETVTATTSPSSLLCAASPVPTLTLTLSGSIDSVNEHFASFLGFDANAVRGLRHQAFVHPDDAGDLAAVEARLRATTEPIDHELRYVGGDGRIRWTHLMCSRLPEPMTGDADIVAHLFDIDARHRALASALVESLRDPLTGLPNRVVLTDRLEHALVGLPARGELVTVLFIDLDHLKEVNDSLGHQAGDHLLATVGARLLSTARSIDTVARIGGDEFVIIATNLTDDSQRATFARRLLDVVAVPIPYGSDEIRSTASIGITVSGTECTARSLLDEADAQMYRAKNAGRDRFAMGRKEPVARRACGDPDDEATVRRLPI